MTWAESPKLSMCSITLRKFTTNEPSIETKARGLGLTTDETGWRTSRIPKLAFTIAAINDTLCTLTHSRVEEPVNHPPWTKTRFYARDDIGLEDNVRIQELCLARDKHYARLAEMLLEDE